MNQYPGEVNNNNLRRGRKSKLAEMTPEQKAERRRQQMAQACKRYYARNKDKMTAYQREKYVPVPDEKLVRARRRAN